MASVIPIWMVITPDGDHTFYRIDKLPAIVREEGVKKFFTPSSSSHESEDEEEEESTDHCLDSLWNPDIEEDGEEDEERYEIIEKQRHARQKEVDKAKLTFPDFETTGVIPDKYIIKRIFIASE